MKSLIKPVSRHRIRAGLVVVCGLLIFFGAQVLFTQETKPIRPTRPPRTQDTTLRVGSDSLTAQETYVSEVVISAPWAKKNLVYSGEESPPGEFGVYQYVVPESLKQWVDAGKPEGPTSFTVAPNGDIYITDPLNYRIQRFGPEGQLLSVIPGLKIERYKWAEICVDPNNHVYFLCWEYDGRQVVYKYDQTGKLLTTYPLFEERGRERGAGTRFYCDKSGRLFLETYKSIKKHTHVLMTFQLGTADQVFTPEQQKKTEIMGTLRNEELGKIDLQGWERPGKLWGPHIWNYDLVDEKGNFYLYWSTKEGITITKWYKP